MNHKPPLNPVDVTEGYPLIGTEHLRHCVEKAAARPLARMGVSL